MSTYLWQNFLTDYKTKIYIFEKIKKLTEIYEIQNLVEVWPWKWAITKFLLNIDLPLQLIEKDEKMVKILQENFRTEFENKKLSLQNEDILSVKKQDFKNIENSFIVGNLPYYITSPILRFFFEDEKFQPKWWFFMIQYEVAEKIDQNAKKRSFLRWLLNFFYDVKLEKVVSAKCFSPPPKVKSALISILPKNKSDQNFQDKLDFKSVFDFLSLYNQYSRKTIWKITKILQKKWKLKKNNIDLENTSLKNILQKRLEDLSWKELSKIITNIF